MGSSHYQFILCAHCLGNYGEGGAFVKLRNGENVHRKCMADYYRAEAAKDAKRHVAEREQRGDQRAAFERARAQFVRYPHMLKDVSKYKPN